MTDFPKLKETLERPENHKMRDVYKRWMNGELEFNRARKCVERKHRKLPWDRIVSSVKEGVQLACDTEDSLVLNGIFCLIIEEQERELQAFKDAAAAGMDIHREET